MVFSPNKTWLNHAAEQSLLASINIVGDYLFQMS